MFHDHPHVRVRRRSRHSGGALSTSSSPSLFIGPASASLLFLPGCMIRNLSSILKPASFASIAWLAPDPCSFGVGDEVAEHRRATMKMTAIMTSFMILPPLLWTTERQRLPMYSALI